MKKSKHINHLTRRRLLETGAGFALGSVLGNPNTANSNPAKPSFYESLGVKPVINATGTVTMLGGSIMPPEVVEAWIEASKHFVDLLDLQTKVGQRIAQLIGVEAAHVTTGAAGALLLGTAAVVTGTNKDRIRRLPDTTGMKNEVILQKTHHSCYDNQLTDVGVKLVEIETRDQLERSINERTALLFFMNVADADGQIGRKEWLAIARKHKIPTLIDAAADITPKEKLSIYNDMGFDLVAYSGGKGLMGPNDTGLLLGGKELIQAAALNANPYCGTIGRMMKVSKEDMVALLAAVNRYVHMDFKSLWHEWERRIALIENALKNVPTLRTERIIPPIANHVPHLLLEWNEQQLQLSRQQLTRKLAEGDPPIRIGRVHGTGDNGVLISVFMLQEGEDKIVAERLSAIFGKA